MGIFSRKPAGPRIPSTGNPGDDQLLSLIAGHGSDLERPRHWLHFVYCEDADGAAHLERGASNAGWATERVGQGEGIVAERSDLPVNPANVVAQREFFQGLAASVRGGIYDGWEAAATD